MDEKEICRGVVSFGGRYEHLKMMKETGSLAQTVFHFTPVFWEKWDSLGTELQKEVKRLSQMLVDKGWRSHISLRDFNALNFSNDVRTKS